MDENVRIIVEAVDRASANLKKIGSTGKLSFTEINSAINLANQAWGTAQRFISDTAGEVVNYANQVRALKTAIGATPEQASKLIQVADDVGIAFEQMNSAMEAGIRKGVKPTIENIGKLSDEYLALAPGIERTEYLMDKFGRTGQDLARLMELGSSQIDEMGDSIEGTARLMDQEGLSAAEDYRVALDDLGDAAEDVKLSIGQSLIPELQKVADVMTRNIEVTRILNEAEDARLINSWERTKAGSFLFGSEEKNLAQVKEIEEKLKGYNLMLSDADKRSRGLGRSTDTHRKAVTNLDVTLQSASKAFDEQGQIVSGYTTDAFKLTRQMDDLREAISGNMDDAQKTFIGNTEDLRIKTIALKDQIEILEGKSYLTDEQKAELDGLRGELDETETAIGDLAAAHEEATRRILFGMLEQKLAANGLTTEEGALLEGLADKWGLVDQSVRDAQKATSEATGIMESGVQGATEKVNLFYDAWNALSTLGQVKNFMIRVQAEFQEQLNAFGGDLNPYAPPKNSKPPASGPIQGTRDAGGPVSAGSSYIIGLNRQPEIFTPNIGGDITPLGRLGGDVYNNITINTLPGMDENAIASRVMAALSRGNNRSRAGMSYAGV